MMTAHQTPPVVLDDWLAVSTDGFASMNAGRPPEHLVKELLQNSLDAIGVNKGRIELDFLPAPGNHGTIITCRDDGCGIINLRDIRTIFLTSKVDSHLQRGRMGRGFKEMLCLALSASVISGPWKVEFVMEGGRRVTRESAAGNGDAIRGTLVTMHMPWSFTSLDLTDYFKTFLPPANVTVFVDGEQIESREPAHVVDATLPTELFEDGKWIRPQRKTTVELIYMRGDEEPTLYEMGIPVCPVDWTQPFHVNVLQRVPMNPCRDAVASGYLVKVHRTCLPVLLPKMEAGDVLQDWVGNAVPHCNETVQQEVIRRGFGDNIARSVPKMGVRQFDEDARDIGLNVIETKQTSGGFRQILQEHVPTTRQAVDQHNQQLVTAAASGGFGVSEAYKGQDDASAKRRELIESVGGKEHVQQVMDFARWFCQKLLDGYDDAGVCSVTLALLKPVNAIATWGSDDVLTLGIDTPGTWLDPLGEDSLTTLIHEAAHHLNAHHGRDFHKEMERLAGRAARIMLVHGDEVRRRWPGLVHSEPIHG